MIEMYGRKFSGFVKPKGGYGLLSVSLTTT
nr:MAG TPA: hypothetical protein [Caudoviricetes sp.]